jgi:proline dehydrogenase
VHEAVGRLIAAGTDCEVELLYGLPLKPATAAARSLGVPVRVYVPYGRSWLPYAMREARTNPRTLWWLARDAALGRRGRA